MTTPLFTFVTVRNPRRPTGPEITSGFVRYDAALGQGGALTSRVDEARAADQPVQELIREFRSGASQVAFVTDLEQHSSAVADWADWLAEHAEDLTWAEVDE